MNIQFASKPYMPALVVSVILFISALLPWASVGLMGMHFTENGIHDWGVLTFIMSILGVGLSFVAAQRTRAMGLTIAGILALLGVIIYWATYLQGASAGFGLYIALIAALAVIYIGVRDLRQLGQPSLPSQANPASPVSLAHPLHPHNRHNSNIRS